MKRERFEELLGEKLHEWSATPPEGLFERISASLEQPAAAPTPVVRPRPLFLRYTAAAAAVLLACGLSWLVIDRNVEPEQIVAESSVVDVDSHSRFERELTVAPPAKEIAQAESEVASGAQPSDRSESDNIASRLRALFAEEIEEQGDRLAAMEIVSEVDPVADVGQREDAERSVADRPILAEREPVEAGTPLIPEYPQFDSEADEMWRRVVAEEAAERRRSGGERVVASLFGGNHGIVNGDMIRSGVGSLTKNDMMVYESPDASFIPVLGPNKAAKAPKLNHDMPVSAGLGVSVPLTDRLALETGVLYTYLHSSSNIDQTMSSYVKHRDLHYVGVPVGLSYNIVDGGLVDLYTRGGVTLEHGVAGQIRIKMDGNEIETTKMKIEGIQPSVDLSVGAMFDLGGVGLYAEPGLSYYFQTTNQPESYRTDNPLSFSLRVGLKFLFGGDR